MAHRPVCTQTVITVWEVAPSGGAAIIDTTHHGVHTRHTHRTHMNTHKHIQHIHHYIRTQTYIHMTVYVHMRAQLFVCSC